MPSLESLIFPLILVLFAVPLFLQARKQKRAVQEQQKLQNSIVIGDRVMTTSGLYATVVSTSDETVELDIADGIVTTWVRAAIREKVTTDSASESAAEETTADEDTTAESQTATEESAAEESAEEKKAEKQNAS